MSDTASSLLFQSGDAGGKLLHTFEMREYAMFHYNFVLQFSVCCLIRYIDRQCNVTGARVYQFADGQSLWIIWSVRTVCGWENSDNRRRSILNARKFIYVTWIVLMLAAAAATIRRRLLSNVHRLWNAAMETLMDLAVLLWLPFPLSKVHGSRAISSYCNVCFIAQFLVCRQIVSKQTPSQLARMASHAIRHKFHPGTTTNH